MVASCWGTSSAAIFIGHLFARMSFLQSRHPYSKMYNASLRSLFVTLTPFAVCNDGYHQLQPRAVVSFHKRLNLEQRPFGTPQASGLLLGAWNHLDRPPAFWNARSASGTAARLLRPLYCLLAGDIISVLFPLERPPGYWNGLWPWNALWAIGTEPPALERPPGYWNSPSGSWNAL